MPKTRNIGHTASGQSFHFCLHRVSDWTEITHFRARVVDRRCEGREQSLSAARRHERLYITVTLSHGALRSKPRHGVSVISELFEDFFSVGGEQRVERPGTGSPVTSRNPARTTAISRSIPGVVWKCLIRLRSVICGCSRISGIDRTSPAGTACLLNRFDHSSTDFPLSADSRSAFNS